MLSDIGRGTSGENIRFCSVYILKQKVTSDFHGTVSINPVKTSHQKYYKMFIKRRTHKNW